MRAAGACSMWLSCLLLGCFAGPAAAQEITTEPDRVRLEVGDVRRLAEVLRSIAATHPADTVSLIQRDYLAGASAGLRAYAGRYDVTAARIAAAIRAHPAAYADLDQLADGFLRQQPAFRAAFLKLKELIPGAVFPPIWFIVGNNGAGGTPDSAGVLIAAERLNGEPENAVPVVLHELAHFQSAVVQGVEVYHRIYGPGGNLLALALREGSAELVSRLTTGTYDNPEAERYGLAHERELWSSFKEHMHDRDPGDWMFVRPANPDWPPDLGYWMGYRIASSYYDRAVDKRQAIADMMALTDFEAFLRASGYAERVGR